MHCKINTVNTWLHFLQSFSLHIYVYFLKVVRIVHSLYYCFFHLTLDNDHFSRSLIFNSMFFQMPA